MPILENYPWVHNDEEITSLAQQAIANTVNPVEAFKEFLRLEAVGAGRGYTHGTEPSSDDDRIRKSLDEIRLEDFEYWFPALVEILRGR